METEMMVRMQSDVPDTRGYPRDPDELRQELCQTLGLPADTDAVAVWTRVKRLVLDLLKANDEASKAAHFEEQLKEALDVHPTHEREDILEEVTRLKSAHCEVVFAESLRCKLRSLLVLKDGASDREIWGTLRGRLQRHAETEANYHEEQVAEAKFLWDIREAVGFDHHHTREEVLREVKRIMAEFKSAHRDFFVAFDRARDVAKYAATMEIDLRLAAEFREKLEEKVATLEASLASRHEQYDELARARNKVAQEVIAARQELAVAENTIRELYQELATVRAKVRYLESLPPGAKRVASAGGSVPEGKSEPEVYRCSRCQHAFPRRPADEEMHTPEMCIEALQKELLTLRSDAADAAEERNRVMVGFSKGEFGEIRANGLILIWGDGQPSDLGRAFPQIVEQSRQYYKPGKKSP
jgi:hypothetical protein